MERQFFLSLVFLKTLFIDLCKKIPTVPEFEIKEKQPKKADERCGVSSEELRKDLRKEVFKIFMYMYTQK